MINTFHKKVILLPIFIIGYWLLCVLFFTECEFYKENFFILDLIDTIIVSFSILHFVFMYAKYPKHIRILFFGIVLIICLNLCYFTINKNAYYFLYFCFIFMAILNLLWKKI